MVAKSHPTSANSWVAFNLRFMPLDYFLRRSQSEKSAVVSETIRLNTAERSKSAMVAHLLNVGVATNGNSYFIRRFLSFWNFILLIFVCSMKISFMLFFDSSLFIIFIFSSEDKFVIDNINFKVSSL